MEFNDFLQTRLEMKRSEIRAPIADLSRKLAEIHSRLTSDEKIEKLYLLSIYIDDILRDCPVHPGMDPNAVLDTRSELSNYASFFARERDHVSVYEKINERIKTLLEMYPLKW